WNVLWSWSVKVRVPVSELLVWQRVNHFSEARQLTRKDLLKKHLAKYQVRWSGPAGPVEITTVKLGFNPHHTCSEHLILGLKPVGLSRGRGISLISSLKKVNMAEAMVVQRYLTEPLLVEGYKFDLRLYVLVTSFNPLEAWMYEEGFARFTTLPYTLDEAELGNMHVHLTNSSVQRVRAEAGQLPSFLQAAGVLATLRRLLSRHGVDWPLLWSRVCEVATAALFAAQDAIPHSPNSFELFGFDLMIDAELKVWLLEVNSSPSMGLDTPLDRAIKPRLIADVLELLAPLPFDRGALCSALRARTNTSRLGIAVAATYGSGSDSDLGIYPRLLSAVMVPWVHLGREQ
ncbi:tubulin tyrosine ligase, partial [Volvox carteri f. nagariensis]